MTIKDRYASAVNSSNLKSDPRTYMSDTDVLGAMGIADRRLSEGVDQFSKHPLAVPLERLFAGDNAAAGVIVGILSGIIRSKAKSMRIGMTETQASDMARAVLGWFRKPACPVCHGHGFSLFESAPSLSGQECFPCNGTGKVPLEQLYRLELRELVRWTISKMELESGMAGPAAMKALAPSLEL